jgi:transcriptional regulator with XRE-family HTH domain
METIGEKILEIRKQKGLTQEELADLAKINLRTLQRIEKNETEPRGNTLKMLCNVLELNIGDIIDYGKREDNRYLSFFHLSVLSFVLIPLGNIIIPSILWFTKRDKIIGLNKQGADLLNFQILWTILSFGSLTIGMMLSIGHLVEKQSSDTTYLHPLLYIGLALCLLNIVYPIIVSIRVRKNSQKRYYFALFKFIKQ